jgi:hypothetical protein
MTWQQSLEQEVGEILADTGVAYTYDHWALNPRTGAPLAAAEAKRQWMNEILPFYIRLVAASNLAPLGSP